MPHHLEPLQLHLIIPANSRLALCDSDLLFHGIHSLQVWKQKPPLISPGHDHSVPLHIQRIGRMDFLTLPENVNADGQPVKLIFLNRGKSGILG